MGARIMSRAALWARQARARAGGARTSKHLVAMFRIALCLLALLGARAYDEEEGVLVLHE
jgi:hypothetical protein